MNDILRQLEVIQELWESRDEIGDELDDQALEAELLSTETLIETRIDELDRGISNIENITILFDGILSEADEELKTLVFYILLTLSDHGLFDHKVKYFNYIQQAIAWEKWFHEREEIYPVGHWFYKGQSLS